jgi:methyl coenzyme M reductase subunit C-like uncharacterized protein (methanogenesis marker protein 7)
MGTGGSGCGPRREAVAGTIVLVVRSVGDGEGDNREQIAEELGQPALPDLFGHGIAISWDDALPEHHLHPACIAEQISDIVPYLSRIGEQRALVGEAVGQLGVPGIAPELRALLRGLVRLQDRQVARFA